MKILPVIVGYKGTKEPIEIDITEAPHILIAGTTGAGKSVFLHSLICQLICNKTAEELKLILIDPKKVELQIYDEIPYLIGKTATSTEEAFYCFEYICKEMERRMILFSEASVRNIQTYNEKKTTCQLPYIVMVIDEYSELLSVDKQSTEKYLKRITSIARFTGIHVVLATQRPSVDVISGTIKSNLPTQIAFAVVNETTSKIIIDQKGAEKLHGNGEFLYKSIFCRTPLKCQAEDIRERIPEIIKSKGHVLIPN